jgi:hypothetical protein
MKTPADWSQNPSAEANLYTYDSLVYAFDSSTQNYDGVVDNDLQDREYTPAAWSRESKDMSAWSTDVSDLHPYDSVTDSYDSADTNYDGFVDINHKLPTRWSTI